MDPGASRKPSLGRGARLRELLSQSTTPEQRRSEQSTHPAPRGRAALLARAIQMKQTCIGVASTLSLQVSSSPESSSQSLAEETVSDLAKLELPQTYIGTSGKKIKITANYVRLKRDIGISVFEYSVRFDPCVDAKNMRFKLLNRNLQVNVRMYDGGGMLYLPQKLKDITTSINCKHPVDESDVIMTIKYVKEKKPSECTQLYNVLLKRVMHALIFSPIGRNYFSFDTKVVVPQHKIEIYPGYVVAVEDYEDGLMLCLDAVHRLVRSQNVWELLYELQTAFKQDFKAAAYKRLVGSAVITRYNNKMYVIDDILWDLTPKHTFDTKNGPISYVEYYKKQYNISIKDLAQPLLIYKKNVTDPKTLEKKAQILCFIPELCYLTGLTQDAKSDFTFMKDISHHLRITPNQRAEALRKYLNNIEKCPDAKKIFSDWGLTVDNATIDLYARCLDSEVILFGNGVKKPANKLASFDSSLKESKLLGPVDFKNWVVLFARRDQKSAYEFIDVMSSLGGGMGCEIRRPRIEQLENDRTENFINAARKLIKSEVQILVFIMPSQRTDLYNAIKKLCCVQMPIASQVILARTLRKTQMRNITQKIAMQMTCKLGGSLWSLNFPFKKWMICGIDVYHSPADKNSVFAFVASTHDSLTKWYSTVKFQEGEIASDLKKLFLNALVKFRKEFGDFPSNIIIYRDGISEGQFEQCAKTEVSEFESVLQELNANCGLSVIIVQKRINTRLFLNNEKGLVNPEPGSIADHTITKKGLYDFYLVAQHVNQGTVTPCHYVVLKDGCNIIPDRMQKLSYKLCHLYYNWAGTIRVPAPCMYAHKLAYLVGTCIKQVPNNVMNDYLFYL